MKTTHLISLLVLALRAFAHPVPENPQWLTYRGGNGPGPGRHIVPRPVSFYR